MRLVVALLALMCTAGGDEQPTQVQRRRLLSLGPMPAAPVDPTNRWSADAAAAELGRWLFHEPRLSRNGQVSCASCHAPDRGFADGRPLAVGLSQGSRHTQSLLDAAHQRWLTWDGRADSLWSQALHPFQDAREMGLSRAELIERIRTIGPIRARYEAVFGPLPAAGDAAGVDRAFAQVGKSIAAFERRLVTGPSAFDRWLERLRQGDAGPVDGFGPEAIRGAALFVDKADCVRCHAGPLLSDGEFHMIGVPAADGAAPTDRGRLDGVERLRRDPFNAAGVFSDQRDGPHAKVTLATQPDPEAWGRFRTPSLRSAALSAPYMHQGQLASLEEVVRFYDTLDGATSLEHHSEQVLQPLGLTARERADLVAFLRAVQGSLPPPSQVSDPWPDRLRQTPESNQKPGSSTSQGPKSGS